MNPNYTFPVTREASGSQVDHIFFSPSTLQLVDNPQQKAGVVDASDGLSDHWAVRQDFRLNSTATTRL